jgi:spermidine/putrescine transport system permease protein
VDRHLAGDQGGRLTVAAHEDLRPDRWRGRALHAGPLVLTLPAALGMLAFFVAPLAAFGVYSFLTAGLFRVSGPLTLDSYQAALSSDLNGTLALNSFVVGILAAAVTVAVSLPIAYWLRYAAGRWQLLVLFLITSTLFASYLVRIYAWRSILGSNGLLNSGLERLGVIEAPLGFILYNRFSVTVALVHIFLPYVVLVLFAGFGPIAPALLESAQDLGANALLRWRRVVLPLIAAPAATAFLFVFVLSAADYVTPQFLGGTNGAMLGVRIQANFTTVGDWPLGAATAFLMLAAFVACYGLTVLGLRLLGLNRIRFAS